LGAPALDALPALPDIVTELPALALLLVPPPPAPTTPGGLPPVPPLPKLLAPADGVSAGSALSLAFEQAPANAAASTNTVERETMVP
jgi:hypothetical protein